MLSLPIVDRACNSLGEMDKSYIFQTFIMSAEWFTAAGGLAIGAGTAIVGLFTYRHGQKQSQELKKKEIISDIVLPLKSEYNNSKEMIIAKHILDYEWYEFKSLENIDDRLKYREEGGKKYVTPELLYIVLRDHNTVRVDSVLEKEIRTSFDYLLEFFSRLEFLISLELLTRDDILKLFSYYVVRASRSIGVRNYVRMYEFPLYGLLMKELDRKSAIEAIPK